MNKMLYKRDKSCLVVKKIKIIMLLIVMLIMTGCENNQPISNLSKEKTIVEDVTKELTPEEKEAKKEFAKSTSKNDTDLGLKGIKIDNAEHKLTEGQKNVIEYFDNDYFCVYSDEYEFLKRYPHVYEGAQINIGGVVKKVLSYTGNEYKILLQVADSEAIYSYFSYNYAETTYQEYLKSLANNLVVIEGKTTNAHLIEGDHVSVYGRYNRIDTIQVDTVSVTIPFISAYRAYINPPDVERGADKFDIDFVKSVAKTIFGNNIEVREPIFGSDMPYLEEIGSTHRYLENFCIVELENQSNAKFTKYRFGLNFGYIDDAKTGALAVPPNEDIIREIEFSADFEHFLIFTYDTNLETLNLDYYDKELNKIWNREFEETTSAVYDYTKNNIYLSANNEIFIINIETGEDTYSPLYVGPKVEIRKLTDGILVVSKNKSDGIMKLNLDGSIKWKTNLESDVMSVGEIQLIDDRIVLSLDYASSEDYGSEKHYLALKNEDGSVITDAISLN